MNKLVWRQSELADCVQANGALGRLYIVMAISTSISTGTYVASYRSSFGEEPSFSAPFPLNPKGLAAAMAACQAIEMDRKRGGIYPKPKQNQNGRPSVDATAGRLGIFCGACILD
jgi:hypothetical protein